MTGAEPDATFLESQLISQKSRSVTRFRGLGMTTQFFCEIWSYSPRIRSARDSRLRTILNCFLFTRTSAGFGREL